MKNRVTCINVPNYGKWKIGNDYKIAKVTEDEVLIRDGKNERKNFSIDKESRYYVGNFFNITKEDLSNDK